MNKQTQTIQFVGLDPNELVQQIKTSILAELQNKTSNELELLTRNELSKLLKVNLSTIYRWQNENILPSYSIGNRIYFKQSEIIELLNNNRLS